jgi:anti-sigma B factor antagonist
MQVTIQEQDGNLVATLEGRLDTAVAPETEKAMSPLMNISEGQDIIIDCTALTYISSSGLRIFIGILQHAERLGSHVYLKGITEDVRVVFAMTGLINLFKFI